ncbi:MAG: hypothetical protein ACMVY4_18735 [Minwuia sp.]|uniref:hypothetical protein n=1 Tax=Minwuia sp. TaxID=2493630 RepID=UPI003A8513CC
MAEQVVAITAEHHIVTLSRQEHIVAVGARNCLEGRGSSGNGTAWQRRTVVGQFSRVWHHHGSRD